MHVDWRVYLICLCQINSFKMPNIRIFSLDIMYNQVFTLAVSKLINKL